MPTLFGTRKALVHRTLWISLLLGVPIGLAVVVFDYGVRARQRADSRSHEASVASARALVLEIVAEHETLLLGLRGLFEASKSVERDEWASYLRARDVGGSHPGARAIGFIQAVPADQLERHIAETRKLEPQDGGVPGYPLHPQAATPEHLPVKFIEPQAAHEALLGLDLASLEDIRVLLDSSRSEGKARLGSAVSLVGISAVAQEQILVLPIYKKKAPRGTVEERRVGTEGWAFLVFDPRVAIGASWEDRHLNLAIYDTARRTDNAFVFASPQYKLQDQTTYWTQEVQENVYGQPWTFRWQAAKQTESGFALLPQWIILGAAGLLGLLAALSSLGQLRVERAAQHRDRLEATAVERAKDLATANTAMHTSQERFELAVQGSSVGLWDWDILADTVFYSPRFAELLSETSETIGNHYESMATRVFEEDFPRFDGALRRHLEDGLPFDIDCRMRRADGHWRWFHLRAAAVRDPRGRPTRMAGSLNDIHEQKELERSLILARDAADAGARAKSEFLATMSHEIRTPMNGVIGVAGLLLDTPLTAEQKDYAETIRGSGDALLAIINDILDFSKIESGKVRLEEIQFDLAVLVEDVLDLLAEKAGKQGIELVALLSPPAREVFVGDPTRVRQVLTNLVGNAVKFTQHGSVAVHVRQALERELDLVLRFEVVDTGLGMGPDGIAKLFKPFSQADGSTTRKFGGTGLGLSIAKKLVELMGGEIGVSSEPGKGSTFWFTVALRKAQSKEATQSPLALGQLPSGRALVAVAQEMTRHALCQELMALKFDVIEAESAAQAREALSRAAREGQLPLVALIDLHLGDATGIELCAAMRDQPEWAGTKRILLAGWHERGRAAEGTAAGALGLLSKPVRRGQLRHALARALSPEPRALANLPAVGSDATVVERSSSVVCGRAGSILVVDDNFVNQKVVSRMLEKLGHKPDLASNGVEGVAAVRAKPYEVIFMDCQMPEMDGFEATAKIREMEGASRHTPIIALTANAMSGDEARCLRAGMDAYLTKPIRLEAIREALARWLKTETVTSA